MLTIKALIPRLLDDTGLRSSESLSKVINARYGKRECRGEALQAWRAEGVEAIQGDHVLVSVHL